MKSHPAVKFCLLGLLLLLAGGCTEEGPELQQQSMTDASGSQLATESGQDTLRGQVAVGHLRGARVFLDRNGNRRFDSGEPQAVSTVAGAFSLVVEPGDAQRYPLFAEIIPGQTVDEESRKMAESYFVLEAPAGRWQFISPLTSLIRLVAEKNPSFTEQQAVFRVRSAFGLDDRVSLFTDYLGTETTAAADDPLALENRRTYQVARVIAALLADLQMQISRRWGDALSDIERRAAACLTSDLVLQQAPIIRQALEDERYSQRKIDVTQLSRRVISASRRADLSATQQELYIQRITQNLPLWDVQPPRLVKVYPAAGDSTAIDVTIELIFDEPLDATVLGNLHLELSGPGGQWPGRLAYRSQGNRLTFRPDRQLISAGRYEVRLVGELSDLLGNTTREDITWNFETVIGSLPPALPAL